MKDRAFLTWLHERLVNVHDEPPTADYMHKLRAIVRATPADIETPNIATTPDDLSDEPGVIKPGRRLAPQYVGTRGRTP